MILSDYTQICDALVLLMDPLIEVVIHDIKKNKIIYINGRLSGRKAGGPSLLDQEGLDSIDQIVYPKINFNGRLVKSISIILQAKWLLCINCDVSIFSKLNELSGTLLQKNMGNQPQSLFVNDWQEKLHVTIHSYLQTHNLFFDHLRHGHKKAILRYLFDLGAFNEKNAADYIAKALSLGRATVFKYLKEWRK